MVGLGKRFVMCFSVLLVLSIVVLLVESCVAPVTIPDHPKAGPEVVSVVIHSAPVWKPPIIHTDTYTGAITSSIPGYWVQNGTIEITIKNKSFTPYTDKNGNTINTYYCTFYKTHLAWIGDMTRPIEPIARYQSGSAYAVLYFPYGRDTMLGGVGSVLSFRIQTVEDGYFRQQNWLNPGRSVFEGVGSEWTEFTIAVPLCDPNKEVNPPVTLTPSIKPTSVAPSTFGSNAPSALDPYDPAQTLWLTYLAIIIVTICVIVVPVVVVMYFSGKRRVVF